MLHAGVGVWQSKNVAQLRDSVQSIVFDTLKLETEIGFGGLIHNFKNAVLRADEPEYILAARENGAEALKLISSLEERASTHGMSASLVETRNMVTSYVERLSDVEARVDTQINVVQLDDRVRFDDTAAINEVTQFQTELITKIRDDISALEMMTILAGVFISMIALAGGYFIFTMAQSEQRNLNAERRKNELDSLDRMNQLNADLKRTNTALQQFAGMAAHDLIQPSRQISSFAEMIDVKPESDDQSQFALTAIRKNAGEMQTIVRSLLTFAREGFRTPDRSVLNMTELVKRVGDSVRLNSDRPFELDFKRLPNVFADEHLMERTFTNLVTNAIRYVEPEDTANVRITGWNEYGRTFFSIEDNGIGIDTAHSELIFEPFRRVHEQQSEGQGIGLSIVKSVIEAHGGRIRVDTSYKAGARFVFWLPHHEENASDNAA
ncbi:MAG: hypothetical protein CMK07_14045 [Ponticaulis sp.]|nr:hypothetical protein [Ponticaulis sp.]